MTATAPRSLAVVVHDFAQAKAALALEASHGLSITLVSAPDAARYAGVGFLRAVERRLHRGIVTDCGTDAGLVMAGLRSGLRSLLFAGDAGVAIRLDDIARQLGGSVVSSLALPILPLMPGDDPARALAEAGY